MDPAAAYRIFRGHYPDIGRSCANAVCEAAGGEKKA